MKNEQRGIPKVVIVAIVVTVIVVNAVVAVVAIVLMNLTDASPRWGVWNASTDVSSFAFSFIVEPDRASISTVLYEFTEFTCDSNTGSGMFSVTSIPSCNITDDQFTLEGTASVVDSSDWNIVIQGSFESGTHASGTWEVSADGTDRQTGTWEASAP